MTWARNFFRVISVIFGALGGSFFRASDGFSKRGGGFLRKGGGFICFLDLPKQRRLCKRSRSSSSCHTQTEEPLLSNSRVASVKQVVIAIIKEFSKISNFGDFELFTSTIDNSASRRDRGGLKKTKFIRI